MSHPLPRATQPGDLRPHLTQAQDWVIELIRGIRDDQWADPTPCTDMDVQALVEHLLAVQERTLRLATSGTVEGAPTTLPLPSTPGAGPGGTGSPGARARTAADQARARAQLARAAWERWHTDELSSRAVVHPIGTIPGAVAVAMYTDENLVHGWDLATATGQPSEAPDGLAEPVLTIMQGLLPARRPPALPFADAVEPRPGAGPIERLANWMGRGGAVAGGPPG